MTDRSGLVDQNWLDVFTLSLIGTSFLILFNCADSEVPGGELQPCPGHQEEGAGEEEEQEDDHGPLLHCPHLCGNI
jgi:hypothetical protein